MGYKSEQEKSIGKSKEERHQIKLNNLSPIHSLSFSHSRCLSISLFLSFFLSLVHTVLNLSHLPLLRWRSPISISVSTTLMLCSPSASIYLKTILYLYSNELYSISRNYFSWNCVSRNCISRNCISWNCISRNSIMQIARYNSLI